MSIPQNPHSITIQEALAGFAGDFDASEKNTLKAYVHAIKAFGAFLKGDLGWDLESCTLSDLTDQTTLQYLDWLRHGPVAISTGTYGIRRASLYRFLKYWRVWEAIPTRRADISPIAESPDHEPEEALESQTSRTPSDFGDRMLEAVMTWQVPALGAGRINDHLLRLEVLRARALIAILRSTALRVSDTCSLTRTLFEKAKENGGSFQVEMPKTHFQAHCFLNGETIEIVDAYRSERQDSSPWLFIQHGRTIKEPRNDLAIETRVRGYGSPLGPYGARDIVAKVARMAGYDLNYIKIKVSPLAFRLWHIDQLKSLGLPPAYIQSVLGHNHQETTARLLLSADPGPDNSTPILDVKNPVTIADVERRLQLRRS